MNRHRASASAGLLRGLYKYASAIGLDLDQLVERTGFVPGALDHPEARVPAEQVGAVWREIAFQARDPYLGLHLAEAAHRFPGRDLVSMVMMNCPTVGSALLKLSRYHDLGTDMIQVRLSRSGDLAYLWWELAAAHVSLERHHAEAVTGTLVLTLRELSEGRLQLLEVRFGHPSPGDTAEHRRILGCPLAFDQPRNELVMRAQDLDLPIELANPELLEMLDGFAQKLLDRLDAPDTWAERVTTRIGKALLQGDKPGIEAVARDLAVSVRFLQARLQEEGTTYRALLDRVRREVAVEMLKDPRVTLCDIAFLLGYAEQSVFNHAFKRWTGASPQEYQRQLGKSRSD